MSVKCALTHWGQGKNGRHFPDYIFKCIFLNENIWIPITISLKFVPKARINNIPALVQTMAWCRPDDKPLSKPMMVRLLTHICVAPPQWVKHHCFCNVHFDMIWWIFHNLHCCDGAFCLWINGIGQLLSKYALQISLISGLISWLPWMKALAESVASFYQRTNCCLLSRVKALGNSQFSCIIHTDSNSALYIRAPVRKPLVTSLANINILMPPSNGRQFADDVF